MNLVNEGVLPPDELDDRDERREEQERARSRETLADIVADIRERAENAMRNGERLVHNEAVAMLLRSIADRIEAAWKRDEERAVEHATHHAEAVARDNCRDCVHNPRGKNYEDGNTAAMREALVAIRDAARMFCHQILNSKYNDMMDEYKCRERGFPALLDLRAAIPKANFALSAPPRNCDAGTPEEQGERCLAQFNEWRRKADGKKLITAIMAWAQMPYKAQEGGAE